MYGLLMELFGNKEENMIIGLFGIWLSLLFGLFGMAAALDTSEEHAQMMEQQSKMMEWQDKMMEGQGKTVSLLDEIRDILRR
jgi:uncharacterized protein YacL